MVLNTNNTLEVKRCRSLVYKAFDGYGLNYVFTLKFKFADYIKLHCEYYDLAKDLIIQYSVGSKLCYAVAVPREVFFKKFSKKWVYSDDRKKNFKTDLTNFRDGIREYLKKNNKSDLADALYFELSDKISSMVSEYEKGDEDILNIPEMQELKEYLVKDMSIMLEPTSLRLGGFSYTKEIENPIIPVLKVEDGKPYIYDGRGDFVLKSYLDYSSDKDNSDVISVEDIMGRFVPAYRVTKAKFQTFPSFLHRTTYSVYLSKLKD